MKIFATGLRYRTRDLLFPPLTREELAQRLRAVASLPKRRPLLRPLTSDLQRSALREEVPRKPVADPGDPRVAGWTFHVHHDDCTGDVLDAIRPLAEHRGMKAPHQPLRFDEREPIWTWLDDNYFRLDLDGGVPRYILIVGSPRRVPFRVQSLLGVVACVGRLDFDNLDHLRDYVQKVLRVEGAPEPVTDAETLWFATNGGSSDPTYYSDRFMVRPLAEVASDRGTTRVHRRVAEEATKAELLRTLTQTRPALAVSLYDAALALLSHFPENAWASRLHTKFAAQRREAGGAE
jgi:hypothetical protein